ncbi:hypothetical protein ACFL23_04325, partial [Patescibacteria group bacterium]
GAGMLLRQQRALEWVEMIRDNISILSEKILSDEEFQDGFVFMFEKYLRERNKEKREILKKIFLGFSISEQKQEFSLEKFSYVISQISQEEIIILRDIMNRIDVQPTVETKKELMSKYTQIYGNTDKKVENIFYLVNIGLLISDPSARYGSFHSPFVKLSAFGEEFIKYIVD